MAPVLRRAGGGSRDEGQDLTPSGLLELEVGQPAHGGSCVARHDGRTVFVRHALPGERVRARVTEDKGRYLRADAVEVLRASPDRVPAPCPFAGPGRCGGCDWQHADLAAQRRMKGQVVAEQLQRLAGVTVAVDVEPATGDDDGLGWRTRVRFTVAGDGTVGLHRHRRDEVEQVDRCLIAHEGVTAVGVERRAWPGVKEVEVLAGASGDRAVIVTAAQRHRDVAVPTLDVPVSILRGDGRGGSVAVRGRPGVREEALGRTWRVTGSGFWQVHPAAAERLAAAVVELLDPQPAEQAIDLYCGVGLFAAALAARLPRGRVVAVEGDGTAAEDARHNLADLKRVDVVAGRVEKALDRLGLGRVDLVVLDPPRTGAGPGVIRRLVGLQPRRIAYVACDPAALARDLAAAMDLGYSLTALRAFDLFPMTHHVECVALLEPKPTRRERS